jgi:hypothetical protein
MVWLASFWGALRPMVPSCQNERIFEGPVVPRRSETPDISRSLQLCVGRSDGHSLPGPTSSARCVYSRKPPRQHALQVYPVCPAHPVLQDSDGSVRPVPVWTQTAFGVCRRVHSQNHRNLGNFDGLEILTRRCPGQSTSHTHVHVLGTRESSTPGLPKVSLASAAGHYPMELCRALLAAAMNGLGEVRGATGRVIPGVNTPQRVESSTSRRGRGNATSTWR